MATRAQIERLALRIEKVARCAALQVLPPEFWVVKGDKAWLCDDPERVISSAELAELEARQPTRMRIVSRYVHAENGRLAACCMPGGTCYPRHW